MNPSGEWLVVALLAAWFSVTVAYQLCLRRLMPGMARWDVFRVVPSWHLYTEIPREPRIYFRDRDAAGHVGGWRELPLRRSRRPWRACFNPDLFAADAVVSFAEFLCAAVRGGRPPGAEQLAQSAGWQGVWQAVAAQSGEPGAARQFEVRERTMADGAAEGVAYTSDFQPLPAGKGAA